MNIASESYPWESNLDHGIKDGWGEPGKTVVNNSA
jgi:hypothetical protein